MNRTGRVDRQPAWVLHRRPYRESSLLVELFTRDHGRVGAVVRGARGRAGSSCQPFQPVLVSWSGRGDLKTLIGAERTATGPAILGERLYSALYVNEILVRSLASHDPHPAVFDAYGPLLVALADEDVEPALRRFELLLLGELGYALEFGCEAQHGEALEPQALYSYTPSHGFLASPEASGTFAYPGWSLAAMARGDFSDPQTRRLAKRLLRDALAPLLGERPVRSREYFRKPGAGG